jgi:hypothetical protein
MILLAGAILAPLLVLAGRLVLPDRAQCERQCARQFPGATGSREWLHPSTCACSSSGRELGEVARLNRPDGPVPPGESVCGTDGVTYGDRDAAAAHGTTPLHAGPCGMCSNAADIAVYRKTADTLTEISTRCAFLNTVFGETVGAACMTRNAGLSPACTDCWIENMSCTATHCLGVCLASRMKREPRNYADGRLNDCLACDEAYCGGPFIQCAGANRRRAGIVSDIQRPQTQLWKETQGHR